MLTFNSEMEVECEAISKSSLVSEVGDLVDFALSRRANHREFLPLLKKSETASKERQGAEHTDRKLHTRHSHSPFFYDVNCSRKGTYLVTRITRLYLGYRKGEEKDDKAYKGIHVGQAGKFDGPIRTANTRISLALGQGAETCVRSDLN